MCQMVRLQKSLCHLCQKPAKSGSARIWKCVLTSPSGGYLCNLGHNGFPNCGKLLINWEPARGRCPPHSMQQHTAIRDLALLYFRKACVHSEIITMVLLELHLKQVSHFETHFRVLAPSAVSKRSIAVVQFS